MRFAWDPAFLGCGDHLLRHAAALVAQRHHLVALCLQLVQHRRQHGRGALVDVVHQDDTAPAPVERRHGALGDFCGTVLEVILRIDVDIHDHLAAGGEGRAQPARIGEIGEAEEGGVGGGRLLHRLLAALDFRECAVEAHRGEIAVAIGVASDGMAARHDATGDGRIGLGHLANHQEGRLDAEGIERIEHFFRFAGHRAVVEGQHHLALAQADVVQRADRQHAPGQRVRMHGAHPGDGVFLRRCAGRQRLLALHAIGIGGLDGAGMDGLTVGAAGKGGKAKACGEQGTKRHEKSLNKSIMPGDFCRLWLTNPFVRPAKS